MEPRRTLINQGVANTTLIEHSGNPLSGSFTWRSRILSCPSDAMPTSNGRQTGVRITMQTATAAKAASMAKPMSNGLDATAAAASAIDDAAAMINPAYRQRRARKDGRSAVH